MTATYPPPATVPVKSLPYHPGVNANHAAAVRVGPFCVFTTLVTVLQSFNLEADGLLHPRSYSTNPRVLGYYVRNQKVLTLEDAVRKMTSLPAQILGLRDRGQIREGFAADLVVFDPATVRETNSFEKPKSYSIGIPYTIVNGVVVIEGCRHTGARPGRAPMGRAYLTKN